MSEEGEESIHRILMLAPCDIFPPVHGAGTAAYFTIKHLAQENQLSVLLNHAYSLGGKMNLVHPNLTIQYCRKTVLDDFGFRGVVFNPFYLKDSFELMKSHNCDVIQCELLWTVTSGFLLKKKFNKPLVLVDRNVEYLKFRQMRRVLYSNFVRKLEKVGCERADRIVVVSEIDKANLMRLYGVPEEKIKVIRNCADPDVFKFSEEGRSFVRKKYSIDEEKMVLTFVGKLDYVPNVEAVKYIAGKIYPTVVREYPESVFLIIGEYHEPLMKYGRENLIFTGYVENLSDYLSASDIVLVPLDSGSGTRLKILEAASCSRPIVSTKKGAEGLDFVNNRDILLSERVDSDFVSGVVELMEDEELREDVGKNARKRVEEKYSWGKQIRMFDEVYAEIV